MPSLWRLSCTCGNLKMMEMSLARFCLASLEIWNTFSRQLKAILIMSLLRSKCYDFSFVKITMNDFMMASLSSAFFWSRGSSCSNEIATEPSSAEINLGEVEPKKRLFAALRADRFLPISPDARRVGLLSSFLIEPKMFSTWVSASYSIRASVLLAWMCCKSWAL